MFFRFESPWVLLFLLILPILALMPFWARRWTRPAVYRYSDISFAKSAKPSWKLKLRSLLSVINLLVIALVIIALARPQTGQAHEVVQGEGVDITLALDISGSMASLDFQPQNRLEAAKKVMDDFITKRPYDRIGLVVFASSAFHQSPPTTDHKMLSRFLEQTRLSTDLGIEDHTAMGMGLANAANMLKDSKVKSKVVILLTDGVNNSGEIDPLTAAEAAKSLAIKVYTIGMGRPGKVPVPVTDAFGRKTVTYEESQLDEETLKAIAEKTGGLYYRAEDTTGLQKIYDDINQLEKSRIEVQRYTRYQELVDWVLFPAMLLFLLEIVLRETIWRTLP